MLLELSTLLSLAIAGLLYVVVPRKRITIFLFLVLTGAVLRIALFASNGGWAYFAFLTILVLIAGFLRARDK